MTHPISGVDGYLDHLLQELHLSPHRTRRILVEVEDHLREAVERERARGLAPEEAERRAIDRFGSPRTVARRFAEQEGRLLPPSLLLHLALSLGVLAGVGLAAIGVSGALAAALGGIAGKDFVAADPPGVTYTVQRCADFFEYHPEARDCAAAAAAHHFDEVVGYRLGAGVLGAVLLVSYVLFRRRYRYLAGVRVLPDGFTSTIGAALFGVAALGLLAPSTMQIVVTGTDGAGALLSGGVISLALFAVYAVSLLRVLTVHAARR